MKNVEQIQITFATAEGAMAHKASNGGWVFVADQCPNGFWFDASHFTASAVLTHPVTSGKNGKLI